jgi:hypothetical protein
MNSPDTLPWAKLHGQLMVDVLTSKESRQVEANHEGFFFKIGLISHLMRLMQTNTQIGLKMAMSAE